MDAITILYIDGTCIRPSEQRLPDLIQTSQCRPGKASMHTQHMQLLDEIWSCYDWIVV
jgi:hypothetical protein